MENLIKRLLSVPNENSKEQIVKSLFKKYSIFNILLITSTILFLSIVYIISPSLINYFTVVLTLLIILLLNAIYFFYIIAIALCFRNRNWNIANSYFVKNSFRINLFFSILTLLTFSIILLIFKFN